MGTDNQVILFDGVCNLCNGAVQWIIRHDKHAVFKFAALQSDYAQAALKKYNLPFKKFDSILLIDDGIFQKSNAVLRIVRKLPGAWRWLYGFKIVPRFMRDFVYDVVARNRYKMFGRTESCMIPTPALQSRFL